MATYAVICDGGKNNKLGAYFSYLIKKDNDVYDLKSEFKLSNLAPELLPHGAIVKETNNIAEYASLYYALFSLYEKVGKDDDVVIFMDSELIINQILELYSVKKDHLKLWWKPTYHLYTYIDKSAKSIQINYLDNKKVKQILGH